MTGSRFNVDRFKVEAVHYHFNNMSAYFNVIYGTVKFIFDGDWAQNMLNILFLFIHKLV